MTMPRTLDEDAMFDPRAVFDLTGASVIVTGAGGGIGAAIARLFVTAGASVLCADVLDRVDETTAALQGLGGRAEAYRVNIAHEAEVRAMIAAAVDRFGRLDVMVNCAAIIRTCLTADLEEEDLDAHIAVNLKGVFFGCKAAAAVMTAQGSGSIVNVASSAIDLALPQTVAYSMTKAAVAQLTKCLAAEVGPRGVRVNTVAPGFVVTPMTSRHFTNEDGSIDEAKRDATVAQLAKGLVLDQLAQPIDIAHAVFYLSTPAARHVTGQILRPNGGISMPW